MSNKNKVDLSEEQLVKILIVIGAILTVFAFGIPLASWWYYELINAGSVILGYTPITAMGSVGLVMLSIFFVVGLNKVGISFSDKLWPLNWVSPPALFSFLFMKRHRAMKNRLKELRKEGVVPNYAQDPEFEFTYFYKGEQHTITMLDYMFQMCIGSLMSMPSYFVAIPFLHLVLYLLKAGGVDVPINW